jgi:hypothetical protein
MRVEARLVFLLDASIPACVVHLNILIMKSVLVPEYMAPRAMKLCVYFDDLDMIPRCLPIPKSFKLFGTEGYQFNLLKPTGYVMHKQV